MDLPNLHFIPPADIYWVAAFFLSIIISGGTLAVTFAWKLIKKDRNSIKNDLISVKEELTHQRTNCLATLQSQGAVQIELLGKIVEGQAHQSGLLEGFIKAQR